MDSLSFIIKRVYYKYKSLWIVFCSIFLSLALAVTIYSHFAITKNNEEKLESVVLEIGNFMSVIENTFINVAVNDQISSLGKATSSVNRYSLRTVQSTISSFITTESIYEFWAIHMVSQGEVLTNKGIYYVGDEFFDYLMLYKNESSSTFTWQSCILTDFTSLTYSPSSDYIMFSCNLPLNTSSSNAVMYICVDTSDLLKTVQSDLNGATLTLSFQGQELWSINTDNAVFTASTATVSDYAGLITAELTPTLSSYLLQILGPLLYFILIYAFITLCIYSLTVFFEKRNLILQKELIKKFDYYDIPLGELDYQNSMLGTRIDSLIIANAQYKNFIERNLTEFKQKFMSKCLLNQFESQEEIAKEASNLGLHFPHSKFICVIADIFEKEENNNVATKIKLDYYIKQLLQEGETDNFALHSSIHNKNVVALVNSKQDNDDINSFIDKLIQNVANKAKENAGINVNLYKGSIENSLKDINNSYRQASAQLFSSSFLPHDQLDLPAKLPAFPQAFCDNFCRCLRDQNKALLNHYIDEYFKTIRDNDDPLFMLHIKQTLIRIFIKSFQLLNNSDIPKDKFCSYVESYSRSSQINTMEQLEKFTKVFCEHLLLHVQTDVHDNNPSSSLYIEQTVKFITENYKLNLSIADISDNINLNPRYLGTLFKKSTGKTMLEYLNFVRIEKAKKILETSNTTMKQISEDVGYVDVRSFSRFFKRYQGCTPIEYRKTFYNS